jgi:EF hand
VNIRSRLSVGLTAAMVLGLFAPAPLFAQGTGYGPGAQGNRPVGDKMHGRCDTNKDGKVTWDEYRTCHEAWFDRLDTKHQGKVTLDEVKAHARNPARAQAMFERIDTGHTGVVTREQYDTWLHKRFDSLDINHDGVLTPDEMRQSKHHGPTGGPGGALGGRTGPGGPGSSQ